MAAPVAIRLAGAMTMTGSPGASSGPPKSPTSPTGVSFPQQKAQSLFVNLNVREVFETHGLVQTKDISKRVNVDIEKKREELRTLVGERYRDLIDAADTIALMSTSSVAIFEKLGNLRQLMNSLPTQLNGLPKMAMQSSHDVIIADSMLSSDELEIAFELKLSLEAPRAVQKYLDAMKVISAAHLFLLYERNLCQKGKPYKWAFLTNYVKNPYETNLAIKDSILRICDQMIDDFSTSPTKLAECIVTKQVLLKCSCNEIIKELLGKRIKMSQHNLNGQLNATSVENIATTLHDIYLMFIDGQLYNIAIKEMKRPRINLASLGIKYIPKVVGTFNKESVDVEESPRVSELAPLLLSSYVRPLQALLCKSFEEKKYLAQQQSFHDLYDYQQVTLDILKTKTEDLMRIVLGTSKTLWTEAFYPVFQRKCENIGCLRIEAIFSYINLEAFPKYEKLDEDLDLVNYVWKGLPLSYNMSTSATSGNKDVDLKLKCISPHVAEACKEIEERFADFLKDFQSLGDYSLKSFISNIMLDNWKQFLEVVVNRSSSLFLGRFVSSLVDLCPTIWKLMDIKNSTDLRGNFSEVSEKCWTTWSMKISNTFSDNLKSKMSQLNQKLVAVFIPVADDYSPEGEEPVKPSIRVPLQISHLLHYSLFKLCNDLSRVGPQSIPKNVREKFREAIGSKVIEHYREMVDQLETPLEPQTALQLIFDINFCQWFHLQMKELSNPVIKNLQSVIDPFDMDIVTPRLKSNLKRFLFETHLTLGLLFSEESHSFIAQNFKTKVNMSFPISNTPLNSPLPLLPV